jgi:hypothetical protein
MARSFDITLTAGAPTAEFRHDGGPVAAFATLGEGATITLSARGYTTESATTVATITPAAPVASLSLPGCRLTVTASGLGEATAALTIGRA